MELINEVQKLCDMGMASGAHATIWEQIQARLLSAKLGYHIQMPPEYCGVHEDNRNKYGVNGPDSHSHLEDILCTTGWSKVKSSDVVSTEWPA